MDSDFFAGRTLRSRLSTINEPDWAFWALASDKSDTKFFLTNKRITADLNLLYLIEYIIGLQQLFVNPTNIAKVPYGPLTFSPVPISIKSKMQKGDQQMKYTRVTVIKVTNPLCRFILLANLVCFVLWNKPNCSISFHDFWSSPLATSWVRWSWFRITRPILK